MTVPIKTTRAEFQRSKLVRNIEYLLTCSWCGETEAKWELTQELASKHFYRKGWRYASDSDQTGIACPHCKKKLRLKVEDAP